MLFALFFYLLSFNLQASEKNTIMPFTTDGCSALVYQQSMQNPELLNCCVAHDIRYWQGGNKASKKNTDLNFSLCLRKIGMPAIEREIYYWSVRIGGTAYWKTSWRWGYGWKKLRDYSPLTEEEEKQVKDYEPLIHLPLKIASHSRREKLFDYLGLRNFCREKISQWLRIREEDLYFVKINSKGRDAYQVFSDQCKSGYFYAEFIRAKSKMRCILPDYNHQIESVRAYGECEFSNTNI